MILKSETSSTDKHASRGQQKNPVRTFLNADNIWQQCTVHLPVASGQHAWWKIFQIPCYFLVATETFRKEKGRKRLWEYFDRISMTHHSRLRNTMYTYEKSFSAKCNCRSKDSVSLFTEQKWRTETNTSPVQDSLTCQEGLATYKCNSAKAGGKLRP